MKKLYLAERNFCIGEINKELKKGDKVEFDDTTSELKVLEIIDEAKRPGLKGKSFTVTYLKAVIKQQWLIPMDGEYPKLDGPVGETPEEEQARKRSERFAEKKITKDPAIVKDEREIKKLTCIDEEKNPTAFAKAIMLDEKEEDANNGKNKKYKTTKFTTQIVEDDSKVIKKGGFIKSEEVEAYAKALNLETKPLKKIGTLPTFKDHYDAEAKMVSTYTNSEKILSDWNNLHWTKKKDIIDKADKNLLKELKGIEHSDKILKRIDAILGN